MFWQGPPNQNVHGYGGNNGELPSSVNSALKASTSGGIIIGQVVFGWLADVFGRRRMYGVELGIIILATLSAALVSPSQSVSFTGLMIFWRVIMVSAKCPGPRVRVMRANNCFRVLASEVTIRSVPS